MLSQALVLLDRKDDKHRAPMLLDQQGLCPRFIDDLANWMLDLVG
jgi:hypothetical protein